MKNEVEPAFVNDNYWVLFPFHAYWDTSATVTDEGMHKLPMGSGSARLVSVKYPAGGWGLHAWRHLGSLRRQRQPRRANGLPSWRTQEAERGHRNVGRLQEGRSSVDLNGASRHRRRQAPAHFHHKRGASSSRFGQMDQRAITNGRTRSSPSTALTNQSRAITTVVQELPSLGRSRFAAMRISSRVRSPRMIGQ